MTDSQIFDSVGNKDIGLKLDFSVLGPDLLYIAVICAIFQICGKWPASNRLFSNLESEKDTGVAIIWMKLPGIPQCEKV